MKKTTGEKKVGFYLVIAAALLSLVSLLVYRTVPVSYTHLDVYKRQKQHRSRRLADISSLCHSIY